MLLTGTPLENRLDELYSLFQFLDPRILGPLWKFNERFFQVEERDNGTYKVLGYKNLDELRGTIGPYVLRRTRDEVLRDLPDRVDNNFFVEMTDPQWQAYDQFATVLAAKAQRRPLRPKSANSVMSLIKMRLICNALALHDKQIPAKDREKTAPKLGELGEILADQIAGNGRGNGHKAIVAAGSVRRFFDDTNCAFSPPMRAAWASTCRPPASSSISICRGIPPCWNSASAARIVTGNHVPYM
jgi:SNF2 family DNA or RNA helicase